MKLAKLLGVGTSFFGGGKKAAYRLNRRGGLPKFNAGQNPFAPKTTAAAPAAPPEKSAPRAAVAAPKAPVADPFKPVTKPAAAPGKAFRSGWTTRLNPFRAPESALAQPPSAVQAELSLDAIKVVHNDLADADVEVVPVKAHANAPVAAPILPPARRAWEYLGENLMKSS